MANMSSGPSIILPLFWVPPYVDSEITTLRSIFETSFGMASTTLVMSFMLVLYGSLQFEDLCLTLFQLKHFPLNFVGFEKPHFGLNFALGSTGFLPFLGSLLSSIAFVLAMAKLVAYILFFVFLLSFSIWKQVCRSSTDISFRLCFK